MATEREQEILRFITENPLVSQQELARFCGITRSSVAVHISNLMKKGLIRGKGYILPNGPYAAVVGSANLDVGGRPAAPMVPRDSNPGAVTFSPGGVGRNIAHNLALMGGAVRFISVFGDDAAGAQLAESCRAAGVDISLCPVLPRRASAVYLYIAAHTGEMELAVNSMGIYEAMDSAYLAARLNDINRAAVCVADANPPCETLRQLAVQCRPPLVVDPVSTVKAQKLQALLGHIHTLKCNRAEAALLSGVDTAGQGLEKAARHLLGEGITQVVVTLGEEGALLADKNGQSRLPRYGGPVADVTGAGDAFTAALALALMQSLPLKQAARLGLAAAALCVSHAGAIHPEMGPARLRQIIQTGKVGGPHAAP